MKKREQWQSTLGFIWAAAGSAVGLGSIWRFPYIVGANGGAIFIFLFITFLIIISVPVFISEIAIGKTTRQDPAKAFQTLAQQKKWYHIGFIPIITGFLISTFYSVIGGWTLGFLYEACLGNLHQFQTAKDASLFFHGLQKNWAWGVLCHFTFVFLSSTILYSGVRKGIEKTSKLMMPTLLFVLIILSISGLFLPGASQALEFVFLPKWNTLTSTSILLALGQAFFCLSLGQGTMITYGSYLKQTTSVFKTSISVVFAVVIVSLLSGIAVFTIVFSAGIKPTSGESLLFEALPLAFSSLENGQWLAMGFFILIFLAALTSQISATEPIIAFLTDSKKITRKQSVLVIGILCFIFGVPSALSFSKPDLLSIHNITFFEIISFVSINLLTPLSGMCTVFFINRYVGINNLLLIVTPAANKKQSIMLYYFKLTMTYFIPFLIFLTIIYYFKNIFH